jgi:FAD binding domain/Berberine and berberine like
MHDMTLPETGPSPDALASRLRADISGRVITADDADYDEAREVFYGGHDLRPAVIVRPRDTREVARVVDLARETGVELAVRSGGHSGAGHSTTDGGIVLDLADMKDLTIDSEQRLARAQTGLTAGEITTALAADNLAIPFGDTGSVGVGGITLGGGVGFLVRKYGLTIDSLLAAEVVTADGQVLEVDAQNHPDLFWALRGGGGNFGVVTRFTFRVHSLGTVVGGILLLPATPEVVAGFMAEAAAAPAELSAIANVMPIPPMPFVPAEEHGKLGVMALMLWSGDQEAGTRIMDRFRALASPIADLVKSMPYPEMYPAEEEDYRPTAEAKTMFMDRVDLPMARTIVGWLEDSDAAMRVVQLRVLGGAMARVPADATAFAHRASKIMVNVAAFYDGPEDRPVRAAWVADFAAALQQEDRGAYVNFISDQGEDWMEAAYPGATWDRLQAIKGRYDPTNLFHRNHNIPPATN